MNSVNIDNISDIANFTEDMYEREIDYLFNQFPSYQIVGNRAYKPGLDGMRLFDEALNSPHKRFMTIHVAGTNGKGSVSHMLASVLHRMGANTGLYTSPHLLDFRERIKINGEMISKKECLSFLSKWKSYMTIYKPSFFEITTAMAFDHFASRNVDIAVIETGLGGRLDSTNIVTPILSIITNISFDHKLYLGESIEEIALEKAGVIKPFVPVVIGEATEQTKLLFERIARENGSKIIFAQHSRYRDLSIDDYELDLKGVVQIHNLRTVLTALSQLNNNDTFRTLLSSGWSDSNIRSGLSHAALNTGLRGRWEYLSTVPPVLCDVAHNEGGLSYAFEQVRSIPSKRLFIMMGFVADKELDRVVGMLPKEAIYFFTAPHSDRALSADLLADRCRLAGVEGEVLLSVEDGIRRYKEVYKDGDLLFIVGSNFIVAEALDFFEKNNNFFAN